MYLPIAACLLALRDYAARTPEADATPENTGLPAEVLELLRDELPRGASRLTVVRALRGLVSWMLCSAHPARLLRETGAVPMPDAPTGFYAPAAAHPVSIVSLTELVPTNDTPMLRLLAAELSAKTATELRLRARGDPRLAPVMRAV